MNIPNWLKASKKGTCRTNITNSTYRFNKTINYQSYLILQYAFWIVNPKFLTFTVFQNLITKLGFAVHSLLGFKKLILIWDWWLFLGQSLGALLRHGKFRSDLHIQEHKITCMVWISSTRKKKHQDVIFFKSLLEQSNGDRLNYVKIKWVSWLLRCEQFSLAQHVSLMT